MSCTDTIKAKTIGKGISTKFRKLVRMKSYKHCDGVDGILHNSIMYHSLIVKRVLNLGHSHSLNVFGQR